MIEHCEKAIPSMYFQEIDSTIIEKTIEQLMERYKLTSTVKCTCNFHYFIPQTTTKIAMKRINFDENYAQVFDFHHTRYS